MPFTPTHLLAAIPLGHAWRGPVPAAALAIGTVIPDWPLFVPWGPSYVATHSLAGTVTHALPIALAVLFLWRWFCQVPLYQLLPARVRGRWPLMDRTSWPGWRTGLLTLLALWLGILTHVVWDAFTHAQRWGVELLPVLQQEMLQVGAMTLPGYKLLQHGSSLIGLPLLTLYALYRYRTTTVTNAAPSVLPNQWRRGLVALFVLLPLLSGFAAAFQVTQPVVNLDTVRIGVFVGIVSAGRTLALLVFCYCAAYQLARFRSAHRPV